MAAKVTQIKKKIESRGAKVIEVASGKEMVDVYTKNMDDKTPFDAIVSDINMPDLNGDEATKKIRKIELNRKIYHSQRVPIIAITGNGSGSDIKRYLDCKMTDYYIKGDNPELIIKLIANYLNRF